MNHLAYLPGRRVLLYVGGSIAAVKVSSLITDLRSQGAEVRVAMTASARRFVTPLALQSLSGFPVVHTLWPARSRQHDKSVAAQSEEEGSKAGHGMRHVELAQWAEIQVVVGASANLLARLANGFADDVVTTTALASSSPLLVAPAMETAMWLHPAVQRNVEKLTERGALFVGPVVGRLASGTSGVGRMAEVEEIVAEITRVLLWEQRAPYLDDPWLRGKSVLVTAGGTREPIDPARYIGNYSSGKMGNALAREALRLGAMTTLVTCASHPASSERLSVAEVETAEDMWNAVKASADGADIIVMAAAVADYRPGHYSPTKRKRGEEPLMLELVPNVDIVSELNRHPSRQHFVLVSFAAETEDVLAAAQRKLRDKNVDLLVANQIGGNHSAMGADDNQVTILQPGQPAITTSRMPKTLIAGEIFSALRRCRRWSVLTE